MIGFFSNYGGPFKFQADSSFKGRLSYIDTPLEKKSVVVKTKTLDFAYIKKYFYSVLVAEMSSLVIQFYYTVNDYLYVNVTYHRQYFYCFLYI